jgi:Protein of unknown function (DUF1279)
MQKFKDLMNEYGGVAIGVYFAIFAASMLTFSILISMGVDSVFVKLGVDLGGASTATTLGAAWLASKAIQPFRIIGTLALTPIVAKLLGRQKKSPEAPAPQADPPAAAK